MVWLKRLLAAERGSIAVISALTLASLLGISGFAVELGTGYQVKVRNQRVADMAALGAAVAYTSSGQSFAVAQKTAIDIAAASGVPITAADVTQVNSGAAIQVVASSSVPIKIADAISQQASFTVASSATASVATTLEAGCVNVLGGGVGITASGSAQLTASGCAIANNGTTELSGSAAVAAKQVTTVDTKLAGSSKITTTPTANNIVKKSNGASDPYSSNQALKDALCQVNQLTGSSDSDYADGNRNCTSGLVKATQVAAVSGLDLTFSATPSSNVASYKQGADYVVPAGTYTLNSLSVSNVKVTFQGPVTLIVNQVTLSGASGKLIIGDGPVTVTGALTMSGTSIATIGNGAHSFGSIGTSGSSSLTVGSGNLNITSSLSVAGTSQASFAIGAGETVAIGRSQVGDGISVSGSSGPVSFVPASGSPPLIGGFSVAGDLNTSGTSGITLPKAAAHYIDGNFSLSGSGTNTLNAGLYIAKGNYTISGGGTMSGIDVSVVMGGTYSLSGATNVNFAAAASNGGSGLGIADIVVASKSSAATNASGSATTAYSGVLYLPNSAVTMSGTSQLSSNGSACMALVANKLTLSGASSVTAKACSDLATASSGNVALIR